MKIQYFSFGQIRRKFCVTEKNSQYPDHTMNSAPKTRSTLAEWCVELLVLRQLAWVNMAQCEVHANTDNADNRPQNLFYTVGSPTKEHLPAPEGWPDKAASTITHHLTRLGEWLMESHATATDKITPSQVMKDRAHGSESGADQFLGINTAVRWFGTQ